MRSNFILSEQERKRISDMHNYAINRNFLVEQTIDTSVYQPDVAQRVAKDEFRHYFFIRPIITTETADLGNINAFFWNNMVTLERGLMTPTIEDVKNQIKVMSDDIKKRGFNPNTLEIEVIGTASSAPASDLPDKRSKQQTLDHRGGDYGGQKANNDYLARQRAVSIGIELRKFFPNAKFTFTPQIIEGGAGAAGDEARYIKVKVKGSKPTKDEETISDDFLNWSLTYQEGMGFTTMQALQNYEGEKTVDATGANKFGGGPYKTYSAKLEISFGQKVPQYSSKFVMVSSDLAVGSSVGAGNGPSAVEAKTVYKHSSTSDNPKTAKTMSISGVKTSWGELTGKDLNVKNHLRSFLITSGYFTLDQVNNIFNSFKDIDNTTLSSIKNKSGNFADFVSMFGGSANRLLDDAHANGAIIDDTIRKKIKVI